MPTAHHFPPSLCVMMNVLAVLLAGRKNARSGCSRSSAVLLPNSVTTLRTGLFPYFAIRWSCAPPSGFLIRQYGVHFASCNTCGNVRDTSWPPTRSARKKRQIRREIRRLPSRSVLLAEDETDLLLFPPLRANWSRRGEPSQVVLSGRNARRVVFGAMNLRTGTRLFLVRQHQTQKDFQAFLKMIHDHYRGWHVAMLLDSDSSHTAGGSQQLAREFNIELLWLPKRSPELNPIDHLWGQAKDIVSANLQYATIDDHVAAFIEYLQALSPWEVRYTSGVLSKRFWLKSVL